MTHIILLDGKLWAFEPPEKPRQWDYESGGDPPMTPAYLDPSYYDALEAYNRAYSLALEQKLEVENYEEVFQIICGFPLRYKDNKPIYNDGKIKENEPIKWEGSKKLICLIAPVKEENSAMSYTEGAYVDNGIPADYAVVDEFTEPVPSEQENQEELWKEVEEILLCDSGIRSTMFELKRLFTLTRK